MIKVEITKEILAKYRRHLEDEEKSEATIEKYMRDIGHFVKWVGKSKVTKKKVLEYKDSLIKSASPASVNSYISSLNSLFVFCGRFDLKVRAVKIQQQVFAKRERELTKAEYSRLLSAAESRGNRRLLLVMQTICSTGIRVSELRYITVESICNERAEINCKGKIRCVILPRKLCKTLLKYIKEEKIQSGSVFVSKNGKPLDRSNIWSDMKKLCKSAGVLREKVFPHNLRHLFARTYYSMQKDIVRLADILGHSSVNTTRIYTMESGDIHRRQIQKLGLLLC